MDPPSSAWKKGGRSTDAGKKVDRPIDAEKKDAQPSDMRKKGNSATDMRKKGNSLTDMRKKNNSPIGMQKKGDPPADMRKKVDPPNETRKKEDPPAVTRKKRDLPADMRMNGWKQQESTAQPRDEKKTGGEGAKVLEDDKAEDDNLTHRPNKILKQVSNNLLVGKEPEGIDKANPESSELKRSIPKYSKI